MLQDKLALSLHNGVQVRVSEYNSVKGQLGQMNRKQVLRPS